ncbi:RdgB/HAM1 family non-canonical purine NTP pyrophosphatase [Rikenella microfusus]|uniref:dITP/XTP pyrophosphatase n=1 Tax=Rikenella microfusus TaxID=28139 RepID=A0A379MNR1_9BACT|nr:RdgB/HAM1 family non-canonical purine NTP pyrophosphatase [Rikenella microfusus]SUE33183.1 Non-canonical purine NTP pyrophosphatase [Rikenella microfusus]HJE88938.1 RdgB/HAM1 family non-canonical purine NTP pyrophosphatase [Rikenella microfusus]
MKIVFATGNRNKLKEIQALIGSRAELSTPADHGITEDIPEDRPTLEGNALQKARYIYEKTGLNCFADDTGLEVEALDGEPGVYSARYAAVNGAGEGHSSADNMALLLERLRGAANRRARFRTVIALILEGREYLFEGIVNGEITEERSGAEGFGYDPVFRPDGYAETFAEMPLELKNSISHRGRATAKLIEFLSAL